MKRSSLGSHAAREAAARAPLVITHIGAAATERVRSMASLEDRIRREGAWLRTVGLEPSVFCGGGWYIDEQVATAAAELGYVDCTATAFPTEVPGGRAVPTDPERPLLGSNCEPAADSWSFRRRTHWGCSYGICLVRRSFDEPVVHLYFHDTDLLDRRRALALKASLAFLARRRIPTDLDRLAVEAETQQLPVRNL